MKEDQSAQAVELNVGRWSNKGTAGRAARATQFVLPIDAERLMGASLLH